MSNKITLESKNTVLLESFNATSTEYPQDLLLHQMFEIQVEKTPNKAAVFFNEQMLTYRQLNQKANQLARLLREKGIKKDQVVGLMVNRSMEMIVSLFGILKAGGAYLPIDPEYPESRIQYMLTNSETKILLTERGLDEKIEFCGEIIYLEKSIFTGDTTNLININTPSDLVYVIYTSGSTGLPKGVMLEHRNLTNLLCYQYMKTNVDYSEKTLQFTTISFDVSFQEIFSTLLAGGQLFLISEELRGNVPKLFEFIETQQITILFLPVAFLKFVFNQEEYYERFPRTVKHIITAGEQLIIVKAFKEFLHKNHVYLHNHYGPSETHVVTTLTLDPSEMIPELPAIGKPISNTKIHIVDETQNLVSVGEVGELYIAGEAVGRGYINRDDLTHERFLPSPFSREERMYKTGDLARWLSDGKIEFLGRIDHQVKIRGFRVELGEIETQLLNYQLIIDAVVIDIDDGRGSKFLCGYLVTGEELSISNLRGYLLEHLPDYMVPSYFVIIDKIPLTPSGKVDRKALPELDMSNIEGREYVAPHTKTEQRLSDVWQQVIGIERIGITDNFFELGGHSLKATFMVTKIHREFNVELTVKNIFEYPTIQELAKLIEITEVSQFISIEKVPEQKVYPVSPAQRRIYSVVQLAPEQVVYNMPYMWIIKGELDFPRLNQSFKKIVQRHDSLRTYFALVEGDVVQKIIPETDFSVIYQSASKTELDSIIHNFVQPFDLSIAPLIRVNLVKVDDYHVLMIDLHHIVGDGVSFNILFEEFTTLYDEGSLAAPEWQYKDYTIWMNKLLKTDKVQLQEKFWLETFGGELPNLNLPTDFHRPPLMTFEGDRIRFTIKAELVTLLEELSQKNGATLYMALQAVLSILLGKYSNQDDIIIGSPISGRLHVELEKIIGMFVNTIAIRSYPQANKTFIEFLHEVKDSVFEVFAHQEYPFEQLVEKINLQRDLSRNPLFDIMFTLQDNSYEKISGEGLNFNPYKFEHRVAKMDLAFIATEAGEEILVEVEYNTNLFKHDSIERMAEHFINIITSVTANPETTIAEIDLKSQYEKEQILIDFNRTAGYFPADQSISELFEEEVRKYPEKMAVVHNSHRITFRELNAKVNELAYCLKNKSVDRGKIVGIFMERSLEFVIATLAVLKSGAAFLPIDPIYPKERIKYMIEDSGTELLLTVSELQGSIDFLGDILIIDVALLGSQNVGDLMYEGRSVHDLAYIIYTSGSTGKPKGVMLEHQGVANLKQFWSDVITPQDKMILFASISFDASIFETFVPLLNGATVYIPNRAIIDDTQQFEKYVTENQITILALPPIYASQLEPDHVVPLRAIITAGSATNFELVNKWKDRILYINGYGPTESTVCATRFICKGDLSSYQSVPIGKPMLNETVVIIDAGKRIVPIGIRGELCIIGPNLARGYLNRADLTAEKFIEIPELPGVRAYRTGDLVRWLADGNIEYLGRIDQQVQVRGFRVEIGEIESHLLNIEEIEKAYVLAKDGITGVYLVGYIVLSSKLSISTIKETLGIELPNYMIPSYIIPVNELPLTPNGKVDHKKLPEPDLNQRDIEFVAPTNQYEEKLVNIWASVLGVAKISITDNFFHIGGDSIKAIQIIARANQQNLRLTVRDIFNYKTIQNLVQNLDFVSGVIHINQDEITGQVLLTPIQKWFFENKVIRQDHWNMINIFRLQADVDLVLLEKVFKRLIIHHDAFRMTYQISDQEVIQWNRSVQNIEFKLNSHNLTEVSYEEQKAQIRQISEDIQSFDLEKDLLIKAVVFNLGNQGQRLLIAVHHMIIDGISWRIIIEDIETLYTSKLQARLPLKTTSFKEWSYNLHEYAKYQENKTQYWQEIVMENPKLPFEVNLSDNILKDHEIVSLELSKDDTTKLLTNTSWAYNTEINDLLLSGLLESLPEVIGVEHLLLSLEGHGREEIIQDVDISRTVGWFTTSYPVYFVKQPSLEQTIIHVKETLRQIPDKGIHYGLARYLKNDKRLAELNPLISFNYLGQFDIGFTQAEEQNTSLLSNCTEEPGEAFHHDNSHPFVIDVYGMIVGDQLQLNLKYNPNIVAREQMSKAIQLYRQKLLEIIQHCGEKEAKVYTPSDFGVENVLTSEDFEKIAEMIELSQVKLYPLTPLQTGMLFYNIMNENSINYCEQGCYTVKGVINVNLLKTAWQLIVDKYDVLRTQFLWKKLKNPIQVASSKKQAEFKVIDLRDLSTVEQMAEATTFAEKDLHTRFDFENGKLNRMTILQLADDQCLLYWTFHHILMDGWSIQIVLSDFVETYTALIKGENLPELSIIQFDVYLNWLKKQDLTQAREFWQNYVIRLEEPTRLIYDNVDTLQDTITKASYYQFELDESTTQKIDAFCKENNTTPNVLIETAWGILLQKYNNVETSCFGITVSGRPTDLPNVEHIVGNLINTVPMIIQSSSDMSLIELLHNVHDQLLMIREYEFISLAEIQKMNDEIEELFDTMIAFENYPEKETNSVITLNMESFHELTNYNLSLSVAIGKTLRCGLIYNGDLLRGATIKRIEQHFCKLIQTIVNYPKKAIKEIELVTIAEKEMLLNQFNNTHYPYPNVKTLAELFELQVAKTPEQIAIIFNNQSMTYQELNAKANQLARILQNKGVLPDQIVGIMTERSFEQMIGLIAILKAGGAYLPLDPDHPETRIQFMLEDSQANLILLHDHLKSKIENQSVEIINIGNQTIYQGDDSNLESTISSDNLAYIIYTSGTTGQPKGIETMHYNVSRVVLNTNYINVYPEDKVLQLSNYAFDGSTFDIYGALLNGATLVMLPKEILLDPIKLSRFIEEQQISLFFVTTALFNTLVDVNIDCFKYIRQVLFGGERISMKHAKKAYEYLGPERIIHVYGPTESTVYASYYYINHVDESKETIPIGAPVANTEIYIVDHNLALQPIGVAGELCISGAGLARGYLRRPNLTAEKFVDHPFKPGSKLYRTGDLARWLPDGNIEFLGRIDHQVKIRGFRIELGEIESRLMGIEGIQEAIVLTKDDSHGSSKYLCGYFVTDKEISISEIKNMLATDLPSFMIPTYLIQLDQMPLNINGKINQKALPEPDGQMITDREYIAPTTDTELKMVTLWSLILGLERIGIDDNFFDLGGHSLNAMQLAANIGKVFDVEVQLTAIFNYPTVRELSKMLNSAKKISLPAIEPIEHREYYPASSAQKRIFALRQLEGEKSTAYNMPHIMEITGIINLKRFEATFKTIIQRHHSLRTSFDILDGEVVQKITDVDFKLMIREASNAELDQIVQEFIQPFDLAKAPLIRIELVRFGENQSLMLLDIHHIVSDGISMNIIFDEFCKLYTGVNLEPLKFQYEDFAVWHNQFLNSEQIREQKAFWLKTFTDLPVLHLPTDYFRPTVMSYEGDRVKTQVDQALLSELMELANSRKVSLFMLLLAAFNVLLARYANQEDIVVGTPIAGRNHPDLDKIVGMFVNTLAIRNFPEMNLSFDQFLSSLQKRVFDAFENQDYPLDMLIDHLKIERDKSRNPLFDVLFALQDRNIEKFMTDELELKPFDFNFKIAKFDLMLYAMASETGVLLDFEYNTNLFTVKTIEQLGRHFINLLKAIVASPDLKLGQLRMISKTEMEQILTHFNHPDTPYPKNKSIVELFEAQVLKTPNNLAVVFEDKGLTYDELNRKANQLARRLREKGVCNNDIIAIRVERSLEMLIGILAIIKAGGAYMPIDLEYPKTRVRYMIQDTVTKTLLTMNKFQEEIEFSNNRILLDNKFLYTGDDSNLDIVINPEDLLYIIYTSGSTGEPKGVMVQHLNVNRLISNSNMLQIEDNDRILQTGSLAFDASTFEIWGTLLNGATLYLLGKESLLTTAIFEKAMHQYKISMIWLTAPFFNQLIETCPTIFSDLRVLYVGGDALSPKHINMVRQKYPTLRVVNGYGPTESTTFTTFFVIEQEYSNSIPIGTPVSNTQVYILDTFNNLQPIGIAGELYIGGDGLAKGYLNKPDLTATKFVDNPFKPKEKMYRTGDLVRWLPDGMIEFLGRIDHQVKIRGFRIELGEVEHQLLKHPAVKEAVVGDYKDNNGIKYLCAFVVLKNETNFTDIRQFLAKELPDYMIPAHFIKLEQMPLTINGKINRQALPLPDVDLSIDTAYIAPSTEIEKVMVRLWSDILGIDKVGIQHNFFELGGHSLKATQFTAKLLKELNVELPLRKLFETPTIYELANYVAEKETSAFTSIKPATKAEFYPVSSAQKRLFILNQFADSINYNMPFVMTIDGDLNKQYFEKAFQELVQRHESLRTSFKMVDGEVYQIIHEAINFNIQYLIAEKVNLPEIINQFIRPFELQKAPLLRVQLVCYENHYLFLLDMHHIISDGFSMNILFEEFAQLYEGKKLELLRIQYKDYAVWQNEFLNSVKMKQQEEYWLNQLSGELPTLELPTDFVRPAERSFAGDWLEFMINEELCINLAKLTEDTGTTLYMTLLALFNVLVAKYTGQADIIVGSPVAGRPHADLENIVGMFVNTLVLRNQPLADKSFKAFLQEVKETSLGAFENQDYQFEMLVDKLYLQKDTSRNPIFDIMFSVQNVANLEIKAGGLTFTDYPFDYHIAKFDLTFNAMQQTDGIKFILEYSTKLFARETIERLGQHFIRLVQTVIKEPSILLKDIDITLDKEKICFQKFNETWTDYPRTQTLPDIFEKIVAKDPDHPAIIFDGQMMTYHELNTKANQLARFLRSKGVVPEQVVGIMADRSFEQMIGILGILKAGGAYLPIDPAHPESRIQFMLEDSQAKLLLIQEHLMTNMINYHQELIKLSSTEIYERAGSNIESNIKSDNLAYIIYTSGTTGKPKGIETMHYNISRVVVETNYIQIRKEDKILQLSNYAFDGSTFDIYGALLNGATLVMLNKEILLDPLELSKFIEENGITLFFVTTALFNTLVEININCFSKIRKVLFGGERISIKHAKKAVEYMGQNKIIHVYGPTESTVYASYYPINYVNERRETIPIGSPLANTEILILDPNLHLQPIGVAGELCIAGEGLARGYIDRPELTLEKFIKHPFDPAKKLYRTGDLARWLADGNIEFLGRIDHQVKIRGFRIELGEIETQLMNIPEIKEAIVVAKDDSTGSQYLCAYYVAEKELSFAEIKEYLTRDLPSFMIPSYFVLLERLPLNLNGKVDKKALPEPDVSMNMKDEYHSPTSEIEIRLAAIWSDILKTPQIGITDDFFELGGHSLKATHLVARMMKEFRIEISLKQIFNTPNIKQLAEYIENKAQAKYTQIKPVESNEYYPVSSAQKRLFAIHQLEGADVTYNMPIAYIIRGDVDQQQLEHALQTLIQRHEALRTSFEVIGDMPIQRVHSEVDFHLDVSTIKESNIATFFKEYIRPFDLSKAPLMRAVLAKTDDYYLFIIDLHHIIADGFSLNILFEELAKLYEGRELKPLSIHYKDFSVWQNEYFTSKKIQAQEMHWLERFYGELPILNMPTDFPRPTEMSFTGDVHEILISPKLTSEIKELATSTGTTLYMTLLAAINVLLNKYTGQDDIIIGSPIAGRSHVDVEQVVGMFVNTLALRNQLQNEQSFTEFLMDVKEETLQAFENQDYQFEMLIEKLELARDLSRNPLIDIVFALQNVTDMQIKISNLVFEPYNYEHTVSKFDLTFNVMEKQNQLVFSLEYRTDLYKPETIVRLGTHLISLLNDICNDPHIKLYEIDILSKDEKELINNTFNKTTTVIPEKTIYQLFEDQVQKNPDRIAVVCDQRELTYHQLNCRANQLARKLVEKGLELEDPVGIMVERSLEMVISVLAVQKAGGAYVPIDPDYRGERVDYIIEDSQFGLFLTQDHLREDINFSGEVINIDDPMLYTGDDTDLHLNTTVNNLIYIIYTSGSTGQPKGVQLEHRGVVNFIIWRISELGITEEDVILQPISFSFDGFGTSLYCSLLTGAKLVLPSDHKDYFAMVKLIKEESVTNITAIPSIYKLILNVAKKEDLQSLKVVSLAGEKTNIELLRLSSELNPEIIHVNEYGPTENSIGTTALIGMRGDNLTNIGKPIYNNRLYILNHHNQLAPIGVVGELCVSGYGLARGYLHRPELTLEKFIQNPINPDERLYRTGDLARWFATGEIELLGRIDNQVNIRGYRIELGEIETQLLHHPAIREAIVIERKDEVGEQYLCSYVVIHQDIHITMSDLKGYLFKKLPFYMVPTFFVTLESIPLTENGKLDYQALPEPEDGITRQTEYVAATTADEQIMADIWAEVLKVEHVGIHDDFFDLGGDSIKAIQVLTRANQHELFVTVKDIFKQKTISNLLAYVDYKAKQRNISQEEVVGEVLLNPIQHWFFEQNYIHLHYWNQTNMFKIPSDVDLELLEEVFRVLIKHHDGLRIQVQSTGEDIYLINRAINDVSFNLQIFDLSEVDDKLQEIRLVELSKKIQNQLNLTKNLLIQGVVFDLGKHGKRLLIIAHHLIIDGVSWRILIEDINTLYNSKLHQKLPLKTTSVKEWNQYLTQYATNEVVDITYWKQLNLDKISSLTNAVMENNYLKDHTSITIKLDQNQTEHLLTGVNWAYNTGINDLLLSALILAMSETLEREQILLTMEGHGREEIIANTDLSRTIGWFTSSYPVYLEAKVDIENTIKTVKENLRRIPNKGVNFGIARYLQQTESLRVINPEITFNYLGQFATDGEEVQNQFLKDCPESSGMSNHPDNTHPTLLDFNSLIENDRFIMRLSFNANYLDTKQMEELARSFKNNLLDIIEHCLNKSDQTTTASDYEIEDLVSDEEFDKLAELYTL